MKRTVILTGPEQRQQAQQMIAMLPLDAPTHKVTICPVPKSRTLDHNAYYWLLVGLVSNDLGMTKEEYHDWAKENFLIQIYCQDIEGEYDGQEYRDMVEAVKECRRQGMAREADKLGRLIIKLTSTTRALTKQMVMLTDAVKGHAGALGIRLPARPEDLYYEAMKR